MWVVGVLGRVGCGAGRGGGGGRGATRHRAGTPTYSRSIPSYKQHVGGMSQAATWCPPWPELSQRRPPKTMSHVGCSEAHACPYVTASQPPPPAHPETSDHLRDVTMPLVPPSACPPAQRRPIPPSSPRGPLFSSFGNSGKRERGSFTGCHKGRSGRSHETTVASRTGFGNFTGAVYQDLPHEKKANNIVSIELDQ